MHSPGSILTVAVPPQKLIYPADFVIKSIGLEPDLVEKVPPVTLLCLWAGRANS